MKRLREQRGAADPVVAEAARLVAARAPLADDAARRQRVRARLRRPRAAPRAAAWLRVAAVVALVCSVAVASAMIGRVAGTIRSRLHETRAKQERDRAAHHHHGAATAPVVANTPIAAAPVVAPAPMVAPAPVVAPAPIPPAPRVVPSPVAPHRAPPPIADERESEEQRLLAAAVRALRHQHDPGRAEQLLARYLDRFADAAAAEDALALALEATIGRDPPRAAGFAARYLARYPRGRWSSLARRALDP